MRWIALVALCLVGCSPKFTAQDGGDATMAVRGEVMLTTLCAPGAACKPEEVRGVTRMVYCRSAGILVRHGLTPPKSDITCTP